MIYWRAAGPGFLATTDRGHRLTVADHSWDRRSPYPFYWSVRNELGALLAGTMKSRLPHPKTAEEAKALCEQHS